MQQETTEAITEEQSNSCNYTDSHFGAYYPDGICIDGYMWDLDSCDIPGGPLYSGGEIPCPECNHECWIEHFKDDFYEEGWCAGYAGEPRDSNPFLDERKKLRFEQDRISFRDFWWSGWDEGNKEKSEDD